MKELRLISLVLAFFCLTTPVVTWAGSCPEGQLWNDRQGQCEKDKTSSIETKSVPLLKLSEIEFSVTAHPINFKARRIRQLYSYCK